MTLLHICNWHFQLLTICKQFIGTFLFQGIVTMTPTVMNNMIHMDMSEVIRMIASNGMILYALTRKSEA